MWNSKERGLHYTSWPLGVNKDNQLSNCGRPKQRNMPLGHRMATLHSGEDTKGEFLPSSFCCRGKQERKMQYPYLATEWQLRHPGPEEQDI